MVAFEDGTFRFTLDSADPPQVSAGVCGIEDGAIFEERPAVGNFMKAFATRSPFAALIIDYGYSRPSSGDTLQAVSRHRFAGLFDAPGESDLTAHVDFSHLKREAREAGLSAAGPMPMGEWLLRLGLQARLGQLTSRVPDEEAQDLRRGAARLADPAQMGALFKVLALTNGIAAPPFPFVEWSS
jgi:NADH dehydrogenase [ubiquinone] 1 alpha subcomplex assembly factor 7